MAHKCKGRKTFLGWAHPGIIRLCTQPPTLPQLFLALWQVSLHLPFGVWPWSPGTSQPREKPCMAAASAPILQSKHCNSSAPTPVQSVLPERFHGVDSTLAFSDVKSDLLMAWKQVFRLEAVWEGVIDIPRHCMLAPYLPLHPPPICCTMPEGAETDCAKSCLVWHDSKCKAISGSAMVTWKCSKKRCTVGVWRSDSVTGHTLAAKGPKFVAWCFPTSWVGSTVTCDPMVNPKSHHGWLQ